MLHGKLLPFGCRVEYKPESERETKQLQKFGSKLRPGIFMGHHSHNGGEWSGDYYVVDAEAFAVSPDTQRAYVHRVKEIMHGGKIVFPVKDGVLLPADPIDRANAKVEGDTVLQGEQGPLDRVAEDLSYYNATAADSSAGAGGTPRVWHPRTSGPSREITS